MQANIAKPTHGGVMKNGSHGTWIGGSQPTRLVRPRYITTGNNTKETKASQRSALARCLWETWAVSTPLPT